MIFALNIRSTYVCTSFFLLVSSSHTYSDPAAAFSRPQTDRLQFFLQHLLVEQHRSTDALSILDNLHVSFPGSSYVLAQTAVAHYHLRSEFLLAPPL